MSHWRDGWSRELARVEGVLVPRASTRVEVVVTSSSTEREEAMMGSGMLRLTLHATSSRGVEREMSVVLSHDEAQELRDALAVPSMEDV